MKFTTVTTFALRATMCSSLSAQFVRDAGMLAVAGRPESIRTFDYNGKSYVGLKDLARLTHGILSYTGNQILLTLPDRGGEAIGASKTGFQNSFLRAGIEQMSTFREWRITVVNSTQNNTPISEEWISNLQLKAEQQLAIVAVAKNTEDDLSGYPLLAAEYSNMRKLSEQFLADRTQSHYIDPTSININPLDQQILACARSLASMAAENQYREESACLEVQ